MVIEGVRDEAVELTVLANHLLRLIETAKEPGKSSGAALTRANER